MFVQPLLPWKSSKYYIFWVCVCSLSYPTCKSHAPCYIVTCGLSGSTIFFHISLSHKRHNFQIKLLNVKCVFWFSLKVLYETFHILWKKRIKWDIVINVYFKVSIILIRFKWNLNFHDYCLKNIPISDFMKIHPVGSELFHVDEWTGRPDKANSRSYDFANTPKNGYSSMYWAWYLFLLVCVGRWADRQTWES